MRARLQIGSLVLVAAVFLGLRLYRLDAFMFLRDEPELQVMAEASAASGETARLALQGTRGIRYGPLPVWVYAAARAIRPGLSSAVWAHALLLTLAVPLVGYVAWRTMGARAGAWLLALMATGPPLFFYARLPWDNTFLIPLSAILLWIAYRYAARTHHGHTTASRVFYAGMFGLVSGALLDTHLVALPIVGALVIWAARDRTWTRRSAIAAGVVFLAALFMAVTPYLQGLSEAPAGEISKGRFLSQFFRIIPATFVGLATSISAARMSYFLDGQLELLGPALGWAGTTLVRVDWSLAALVLIGVILWRDRREVWRRTDVTVDAFVRLVPWLTVAYYAAINLWSIHPHYFNAVWFVGPWLLVGELNRRRLPWGLGPALLILLIASSACFDLAFLRTSLEHGGLRTSHVGTLAPGLRAATEEMCAVAQARGWPDAGVRLDGLTGVEPAAIAYFASGCPAVRFRMIAAGTAPVQPIFVIGYAESPPSAGLKVRVEVGPGR